MRDLAELVNELTRHITTATRYSTTLGARGKAKRHRHVHYTTAPGLITQLSVASSRSCGPPLVTGTRTQPGSRPPGQHQMLVVLDSITRQVSDLRVSLRLGVGKSRGARQSVAQDLSEISYLARLVDRRTARHVHALVRRWHSNASIALTYQAPTIQLRDVACPYCGSALRVRADASTDVWCTSAECVDDDGVRRTWGRGAWLMLLERMSPAV